MVKMKNIKLSGNMASADCHIENSEDISFSLIVNVSTREIVGCSVDTMNNYINMARNKLCNLAKSGEPMPEHTISMWY